MKQATTGQHAGAGSLRPVALGSDGVAVGRAIGQLDGANEASAQVERLVSAARHEVVFLVPDCLPGLLEFTERMAMIALRRGAGVRIVWSPRMLDDTTAASHAQWLAERRSAPRVAPIVPCRAILIDGTVGVVFDKLRGPRVLRGESGADKLARLAARLWQNSKPLQEHSAVEDKIMQPRHKTVLRLLAGGLTDDAVARRLGVSVRTVRNDVASTMTALDARSRFQAGVRAAQLGLI